jgi:hypothetical protein
MNVFWILFNLMGNGVSAGGAESAMVKTLLTAMKIANSMVQVCRGHYFWQHHANTTTLKCK